MIIGIGLGLGMGGAPPVAFDPSKLSGLVLWLNGASAQQTANVLTSWTDLSGAGNSLPTVAGSPIYSASGGPNSKPYVNFAGSQTVKRSASIITGADAVRTMFVVSRATDLTTATMAATDGTVDGGSGFGYLLNWDPAKRTAYAPGVGGGEDATSNLTSSWERVCVVNNHLGAVAGNQQMYVNGVAHALTTSSLVPLAATGGFMVGGAGASTFVGKCDVAEVILYNRVLGNGERASIDTYLSGKYGF